VAKSLPDRYKLDITRGDEPFEYASYRQRCNDGDCTCEAYDFDKGDWEEYGVACNYLIDDYYVQAYHCCPEGTGCKKGGNRYRGLACCKLGDPNCEGPGTDPEPDPGPTGNFTEVRHSIVGKSFIGPINLESADHYDNDQMQSMLFLFGIPPENPQDNKTVYKAYGYRLFSRMDVVVTCLEDGTAKTPKIEFERFHMGYEDLGAKWFQGEMVYSSTLQGSSSDPQCSEFVATIAGIPDPTALYGACMAACYATRTIQHTVEAKVCCDGTVDAQITGTAFPSHRVFVDGSATSTVLQGPLEALMRIDNPDWEPMDNTTFALWKLAATGECTALMLEAAGK